MGRTYIECPYCEKFRMCGDGADEALEEHIKKHHPEEA